jgi:hypothetical protein
MSTGCAERAAEIWRLTRVNLEWRGSLRDREYALGVAKAIWILVGNAQKWRSSTRGEDITK